MADCSLCTTLAKLVTLSPMQDVQRRTRTSRGRLGLHLFVDDVCLATAGGEEEVLTRLRAGGAQCKGAAVKTKHTVGSDPPTREDTERDF